MFLVLSFLLVAYVKNKRGVCFRPYQNLGISMGISASASIFPTFFCLIKFYFKKLNFYVQYTSIFFLLVSYSNHIISACVNIDSHEYRSWREYRLRKMLLHCFNNKFALPLISNFKTLIIPRSERCAKLHPPRHPSIIFCFKTF